MLQGAGRTQSSDRDKQQQQQQQTDACDYRILIKSAWFAKTDLKVEERL